MQIVVLRTQAVCRRFLSRSISGDSLGWPESLIAEKEHLKRKDIISQSIFPYFQTMEDLNKTDWLNHALNKSPYGIRVAMCLREDSLQVLRAFTRDKASKDSFSIEAAKWKAVDRCTREWLSIVFCQQALELKRITFEGSSGNVLEQVAKGEAVHRVRSLSELKRRLENGRRCFALFHHSLPTEPLAFIHVSLAECIASSMRDINLSSEIENPKCAIFYSVNSPHPSLTGLDLATQLIHRVVDELSNRHPSLQYFSTLSPIPGFMDWFQSVCTRKTLSLPEKYRRTLKSTYANYIKDEKAAEKNDHELLIWLHQILTASTPMWTLDEQFCEKIKDPLLWICTFYLVKEKVKGLPNDPVARFHLRNGAILHRVNWFGNPSKSGFMSSAGLMVNYLYQWPKNDENSKVCNSVTGAEISQHTVVKLDSRVEYFNANKWPVLISENLRSTLAPDC